MTNDVSTEHADRRGPLIPPIRITAHERWRLVLVGLAVLVVWWLLAQSFDALGPFIFALVLGYLMLPVVDRLDRFLPRAAAILVVYLVFTALVVGATWWLAPPVGRQLRQLVDELPAYSQRVQEWTASATEWYNSLPLSPEVRQSIENSLRSAGGSIGDALRQATVGLIKLVSSTMGFIVGLVIVPFWLFYVLKDKDRAIGGINNMLPRSWRGDFWRIVRITNGVLSSYIRGQLLLGLAVGAATTLGMFIVGAPFPLVLGIISGFTEVIPVVGPILGAIPGLALGAFTGDWVLMLKILAVYVIVQQLENNLLVPKIQGDSVKLHPAIIMLVLVVGSQVAGLVGLIAAVPVAAIMRDIYLYLYRRFAEEMTPRQAEAGVPSRQSEESTQGQKRDQANLAEARELPGINSEDELIADIEVEDASGKIAAGSAPNGLGRGGAK
ncbi:MAG: AI-2E family transporter [Chloroflexia bacterium]